MPKCIATTKQGVPCRGWAMRGSHYCAGHAQQLEFIRKWRNKPLGQAALQDLGNFITQYGHSFTYKALAKLFRCSTEYLVRLAWAARKQYRGTAYGYGWGIKPEFKPLSKPRKPQKKPKKKQARIPPYIPPKAYEHMLIQDELDLICERLKVLVQAIPYDPDAFAPFAHRLRFFSVVYDAFRYAYYQKHGGALAAKDRLGKRYTPSERFQRTLAKLWKNLAPKESLQKPTVPLEQIMSRSAELIWWRESFVKDPPPGKTNWKKLSGLDGNHIKVINIIHLFHKEISVQEFIKLLVMADTLDWSTSKILRYCQQHNQDQERTVTSRPTSEA